MVAWMRYNRFMEYTRDEQQALKDWIVADRCKAIRAYWYDIDTPEWAIKEAKTIDRMFFKYDSELDKSETIWRGIRFAKSNVDKTTEFLYFRQFYQDNIGEISIIDKSPSSFSRVKEVAFNEFGLANKETHHTIIYELVNRNSSELDIKPSLTDFAHQKEVIIRSQSAKYKILSVESDTNPKNYDTIIIKIEEV
jgi:hypothetical protein